MNNIALQMERWTAGSVLPDAQVTYDAVVYQHGDIVLNLGTGVVTINKLGRYLAEWWVATQSSPATGIVFSLAGTHIAPASSITEASPIKTGETVGFAAFDVIAAPAQLRLKNAGEKEVWYAPVLPVKAVLRVHSHDELESLDDGNSIGSLIGVGAATGYTMGEYAVALGWQTRASGKSAHAEGQETTASGLYSHAEGFLTTASGRSSHAEGIATMASGEGVHAEGYETMASNDSSHAEGWGTSASGAYSHAEGLYTSTNGHGGSHVMGRFGDADLDFSWYLANGADLNAKGLAAKILADGNAYIDVTWHTGGADYAEMFETLDGKPIEPGYFVTVVGDKIRLFDAANDNYVLGVTSIVPAVLGNSGELRWKGKYQTDEWGKILTRAVEISAVTDEKTGRIITPARRETQALLSPEYDPSALYIPRAKRPEWVAVGLIGVLRVRDGGDCVPGGYCTSNEKGIASPSAKGYRVLKRTGPSQVTILFR